VLQLQPLHQVLRPLQEEVPLEWVPSLLASSAGVGTAVAATGPLGCVIALGVVAIGTVAVDLSHEGMFVSTESTCILSRLF